MGAAAVACALLAACSGSSGHDGPRWQLAFTDEFPATAGQIKADASGHVATGRWHGYPTGTRIEASDGGIYDPSGTVSVGDGVMHFHLFADQGSGRAAAESPDAANQTYGKYQIRYRYKDGADVAGYKTVWLLWPASNHWNDGEIDINEYDNTTTRSSVGASVHQPCAAADVPCPTRRAAVPVDPEQWHTATLTWTPHQVSAYLDRHRILTTRTHVPDSPMRLVLQTEASSFGAKAEPGTSVDVDVDRVRIYALANAR